MHLYPHCVDESYAWNGSEQKHFHLDAKKPELCKLQSGDYRAKLRPVSVAVEGDHLRKNINQQTLICLYPQEMNQSS